MARGRAGAVFAIAVVSFLLVGCAGSQPTVATEAEPTESASAVADVYVLDCGVGYEMEPEVITLACADGGIQVDQITWLTWDQSSATGEGTLIENTCEPDCAAGRYISQPATIRLTDVGKNSEGKLVFQSAVVRTEGKQSAGGQAEIYELYSEPEL